MTTTGAEVPAIPDVLVKDAEIRNILTAIKQIIEIRNNRRVGQDPNQRFITYYELIDYLRGEDQLTVIAVEGGHNHDTLYSVLSHNHNSVYSLLGHDHDAVYSLLSHDHDLVYSLLSHDHDLVYSLLGHTHARLDWTKITATSITKGAGTHSGTTGDTTGFVADLDEAHDGNYYHIDEVAAGFDVEVHFTSVTAFSRVQCICNYKGSVAHAVMVQAYNWSTAVYDSYKIVPCAVSEFGAGINTVGDCGFFMPNDTNYIGTGGDAGKVDIRIIHSSSGNASHDLDVDCVALYQ